MTTGRQFLAALAVSAVVLLGPGLPRAAAAARLRRLAGGARGPTTPRSVRRRRRGDGRSTAFALPPVVDAMAAELAAGASARAALGQAAAAAAGDPGLAALLAAVADRVGLGAEPGPALREAAARPGAAALGWVASAWEVAERQGAAPGPTLARVAAALRADLGHRHDVAAATAGARASARMLGALPLLGTLVGQLLGADPLRTLVRTPAGWGCLVLGAALEALGWHWTTRLLSSAQ